MSETEAATEKPLSKRKRKAQESWQSKKTDKKIKSITTDDVPINPLTGDPATAPKTAKKKTVGATPTDASFGPAAEEEEEAATAGAGGEEKEKKKKKRFILFIGNLSYSTTTNDIAAHIAPTGVKPMSIRLQTDPQTHKPKGFAFIDFADFVALDKVLNLHHSMLDGRKINIELTAGGGGKGEKRKAKIAKKNEKLGVERETAQKTRREAEAKKAKDGKNNKKKEQVRDDLGDMNPARRRRMK